MGLSDFLQLDFPSSPISAGLQADFFTAESQRPQRREKPILCAAMCLCFLCSKKGNAPLGFPIQDSLSPRQMDCVYRGDLLAEGIFGGLDPFSQG